MDLNSRLVCNKIYFKLITYLFPLCPQVFPHDKTQQGIQLAQLIQIENYPEKELQC